MVGKRTGWIFVLFLFIGLVVFTSVASAADFDTLLVLGSGNRNDMVKRVDGIGELIYSNDFGKIVLSGGCVSLTKKPEWTEQQYQANLAARTCPDCSAGCTEAEEMQKLLLEKDPNLAFKIVLEDKSGSTESNYQNSISLLGNKVVVLSSHPHAKAVSYCLRYSDKKDAYYYVIGETIQPTIIPQDTDYEYGDLVKSCRGIAGPSTQPTIVGSNLQGGQSNPSQGQEYTTSLVSKNLPQQQKEIDESWSVKIGNTIRQSILIWDDTLGPWDWRNYTDVYFTIVSTPVSSSSNQITMGQGSAGVGSYSTPKYSKEGNEYNELIKKAAAMYPPVEPELIKAIMYKESSFNPLIISGSGYSGLMQVGLGAGKPHTNIDCEQNTFSGPQLCNGVPDERFNPEKNILAGTKILRGKYNSAIQNCGIDYIKAWTTAYNMGNLFVDDAIKRVGNCNNWETVWQELSKHWDSNAHTYTMQDGRVISKPWITQSKLDGKRGTPGTYTGDVYSLYLGYKSAGLGTSTSTQTTSTNVAGLTGTSLVCYGKSCGSHPVRTVYNIYVGAHPFKDSSQNCDFSKGEQVLKDLKAAGVQTIINLDGNVGWRACVKQMTGKDYLQYAVEMGFEFIDVPIGDTVPADKWQKIKAAINSGKTVYVHCRHGVHRATSVVAGWLIEDKCMDTTQVLNDIKSGSSVSYSWAPQGYINNYGTWITLNNNLDYVGLDSGYKGLSQWVKARSPGMGCQT